MLFSSEAFFFANIADWIASGFKKSGDFLPAFLFWCPQMIEKNVLGLDGTPSC